MDENDVVKAEKEASEVLHSLLSVERIEKPSRDSSYQQIFIVQGEDSKDGIDWQTDEQQPLYETLEQDNYVNSNDTVVWEGTLDLDIEVDNQNQIFVEDSECVTTQTSEKEGAKPSNNVKKPARKKYNRVSNVDERTIEIENNVQDVRARFQLGCECNDDSCFRGLNPETVYRHRLNIAELTKEEHDMYLMGVTMACMSDPGVTIKRKERRRLRAHYGYQGRRVCLSAFLYLENCTLYQLKRIRKHVMTHGVTPRVHGNHGKKPHNVFSLDIYRRATTFLKSYIEQCTSSSGNLKSPVVLPAEVTRKMMHNSYQTYVKNVAPPDEKIMGYSTFRHFMKEQFPHVRFCKSDIGTSGNNNHSNTHSSKHNVNHRGGTKPEPEKVAIADSDLVSSGQVAAIPIIFSSEIKQESTPAYLVTPVQQIVHAQQDFNAYQPHTITVAPISNTTYAFNVATM